MQAANAVTDAMHVARGEEPHVGWGRYLLRFVTPSGWRELKKDFMTTFKTGFAIAKFRRAHPGFGMAVFRDDALALYTEVCSALAAGEHSTLRQVRALLSAAASLWHLHMLLMIAALSMPKGRACHVHLRMVC